MSTSTSPGADRATTRAGRRRAPGWTPNQHGAWAMLASPLLVGVLASGPDGVHLALAAAWFAGYFAFFATSIWLRAARRRRHLSPVLAYGTAALVLGSLVLVLDVRLVRWGPLFALPLAAGLWSSARRQDRSLISGLATTVGSALMTVVAYDAGGGTDWRRAWVLAAVQAGYFAGTVFYVKSLIRQRGDVGFRRASVAFHGTCLLAAGGTALWFHVSGQPRPWGVSWWVVGVFAVLTLRAALVPRMDPPPRPARIGLGEIAATTAVAISSLLA